MRSKTSLTQQELFEIREEVQTGLKKQDMLKQLFDMQKSLDMEIFEKHSDKLPTNLSEWVLQYIHCLNDELAEVRAEVNWKHWKPEKQINIEKLHEEVSDLWFFLISMTQRVGMGADDIFKVYEAKLAENFARQRGESKDGDAYDYTALKDLGATTERTANEISESMRKMGGVK